MDIYIMVIYIYIYIYIYIWSYGGNMSCKDHRVYIYKWNIDIFIYNWITN